MEIRQLTHDGVGRLYEMGSDLVIMACNTAIAYSARYLQDEVFVDKKLLGVTIPAAEKVIEVGYKNI